MFVCSLMGSGPQLLFAAIVTPLCDNHQFGFTGDDHTLQNRSACCKDPEISRVRDVGVPESTEISYTCRQTSRSLHRMNLQQR